MSLQRKNTHSVSVGNITIGGQSPVVIQSMTDTDTSDSIQTAKQIQELYEAGSEIVRITVNDLNAARAIPEIFNILQKKNISVPLVGCFHYNGHTLLENVSDCAKILSKYRINPGNVGFGYKKDSNFEKIIEIAMINDKPIRIGVNWGSLDQSLTAKLMDQNEKLKEPKSSNDVVCEAMIQSALLSARMAEDFGISPNKIILSAKVSRVQDLLKVYRKLSNSSSYALHLGLTEAGMGDEGIISTTAALAILLQEGIGDTIRASLTPKPGENRIREVLVCKQILQSLGLRYFKPSITSCPGCGRTSSDYFRHLAMDIQDFIGNNLASWQKQYKGVENMKIAVMGCIVNGPGESKHANIGISLPGSGEYPIAPVFIDGEKKYTLRGNKIAEEFKEIVITYVKNQYEKQ